MSIDIIPVTDRDGVIVEPGWLAKSESVLRELRPQIPPDYAAKMHAVFAGGGRMVIVADGERVTGVAVYRIYEDTFNGRKLYCDDLVTTDIERSTGVGHALMKFMEDEAVHRQCDAFALDSGVQRSRAHKFYFREGMHVVSFNFRKAIDKLAGSSSRGSGDVATAHSADTTGSNSTGSGSTTAGSATAAAT